MTNTIRKREIPRVPNRIAAVMHEHNAEATKTAIDLGFNYRGLLKIMNNEQGVTLDQLGALAKYFDVDIVNLIEEPGAPQADGSQTGFSDTEIEVIENYRLLDDDMKIFFMNVLKHAVTFNTMSSICKAMTKMNTQQQSALATTALALASSNEDKT